MSTAKAWSEAQHLTAYVLRCLLWELLTRACLASKGQGSLHYRGSVTETC